MRARTGSVAETRALAEAVAACLRPGDVVVLVGGLGTGKTAFAQGLARGLGVEGPVVSPSFMIVREYDGTVPLTHVDVYRLERFQELFDLGWEEVLDPARVTAIEWGDCVAPLLPGDRLEIRLERAGHEDARVIEATGVGLSWDVRRQALAAAFERFGTPA